MTEPKPHEFVIRAYEAEHLAQFIRLGNGQGQLCEIQPRAIYIVTAQGPETPEEVLATFETLEAATEAAQALEQQLKAMGTGPKLATKDGVTLQ